jgi:two-component system sensor histidine kinase/response regulator
MKKPVILCVDDEQMLLVSLKQQLKHQFGNDYQIETAENGEEALDIVEELLEDDIELPLVISDQLMPGGIKGDELLTQIHAIAPKTLKILLTGQADADAVGKAVNSANLYRYMSKPWEPTDLNLTVTEAIRRYFQDKELAQFYAGLEKKVAERTHELQEKNQFLGIAVHDLKNPLSAIQGFAEMVQSDIDEMPKEEIIEVTERILASSRQMFELISSLLEVNAIESGKINLSLKTIDILPTLQWLVNHYSERAKAKDITLQFQCPEKQYLAYANENTTRQIFDNIISNAVKYSPYGKHIYVRITQDDKHVRCEIQDEGPGLSDEDKQKLFGQFTRLTPKPTGGEHSTGLGLFIVKKLVESQHGKVWCESVLGQGTTFIVEFSVAKE